MSKQNERDTWFKARFNWFEIFNELNDQDLRILIFAIWTYAENGSEPEALPLPLRLAWRLIKGELERDGFYRECGKKGGNPALKSNSHSTGVQGGLNRGSLEEKEENKEKNKKEESKDINNISPKRSNRFKPPTIEEVSAYCQERSNGINATQFIDYYQARGWELKPGQKMKDWKAAVRTWEQNNKGWRNNNGLRGAASEDRVPGQRDLYGR